GAFRCLPIGVLSVVGLLKGAGGDPPTPGLDEFHEVPSFCLLLGLREGAVDATRLVGEPAPERRSCLHAGGVNLLLCRSVALYNAVMQEGEASCIPFEL